MPTIHNKCKLKNKTSNFNKNKMITSKKFSTIIKNGTLY